MWAIISTIVFNRKDCCMMLSATLYRSKSWLRLSIRPKLQNQDQDQDQDQFLLVWDFVFVSDHITGSSSSRVFV